MKGKRWGTQKDAYLRVMSQLATGIPLFFWTGCNWGRLFLAVLLRYHRIHALGTGSSSERGTRGWRGLMGTLYCSSSTLTCPARHRDRTLGAWKSSPGASHISQLLPEPTLERGPAARDRHPSTGSFSKASLHRSLQNIAFFSPHPQCSPPIVVCCLHALREAFAAGESGQRGFPLGLNSLEMLHPVWKRTSGFVPCHGGEQQGILSHHLCFSMPATLHCRWKIPVPGSAGKPFGNSHGDHWNPSGTKSYCAIGIAASVGACSGLETRSHPPFLSLHRLPLYTLLLQPAARFWSCSCHQLSEAGSLLSASLSCLKSSSATVPGLSRLLRHIGNDDNGSQSKAYTTCPFVSVSNTQHSKTWPFLRFPPSEQLSFSNQRKMGQGNSPLSWLLLPVMSLIYFNTPALGQL